MNIKIRPVQSEDYQFLQEMLYEALYVAEGMEPFSYAILDKPELAKYIDNWNNNIDFGLIAIDNERPVGAGWCKLFDESNKGYGFVDKNIPELSMALKTEYRNLGIGTSLLNELCNMANKRGYKTISLSVNQENKAYSFYLKCGFITVSSSDSAFTMIKNI